MDYEPPVLFFLSTLGGGACQQRWPFMNNAHIDSCGHMKMDSLPILTSWKKKEKRESKRQRSTQLAKLSPEWGGSEIIKLYCQSEEGWRVGVTLQSERCTVAEHSRGERRVWSHLEAYRGIRGGLLTASEACPLHFLCFLKICAN